MPLPTSWTTVPVTGTFLDLQGNPCTGYIEFCSSQTLVIDGQVVVPAKIRAELDANGHIAVMLPATDDPDLAPYTGWVYTVRERTLPSHRRP